MMTMVPAMVVGMMATATFACGDNNTTPSETVDKLFQLTRQKNCQAVADLVSDTSPKSADTYVKECEQKADSLVSYSIGQTIYATDVSAAVETEVTIKVNGVEKTNSVPQFLVKRGGDWKLTMTENRSSKPPI